MVMPFLVLFIVKSGSAMTMAFRKNRIEIAEVNASLENTSPACVFPRLYRRRRRGEKVY